MSKPIPVQATRPGAVETDDSDVPVTPEVEHIIRERLETFDEDAKAARPWEDVLADLKARRPLPPSPPLTHPVRLSALAALDIQQAREWHDARESGLGDQFLQRVNETMTRIGQNPHQYPTIIEDVRRANLRQFKYGIWYRVNADGSVVVACLHRRQQLEIAKARALRREPSS